jgi:hypothetical protein
MSTVDVSCDSVAGIVHYRAVMQRFRNALLNPAWICFLWVGITIGVSMIATPVRFTATTITREIALDVGRVVFATILALIVIAQSQWLTPELAERTQSTPRWN